MHNDGFIYLFFHFWFLFFSIAGGVRVWATRMQSRLWCGFAIHVLFMFKHCGSLNPYSCFLKNQAVCMEVQYPLSCSLPKATTDREIRLRLLGPCWAYVCIFVCMSIQKDDLYTRVSFSYDSVQKVSLKLSQGNPALFQCTLCQTLSALALAWCHRHGYAFDCEEKQRERERESDIQINRDFPQPLHFLSFLSPTLLSPSVELLFFCLSIFHNFMRFDFI